MYELKFSDGQEAASHVQCKPKEQLSNFNSETLVQETLRTQIEKFKKQYMPHSGGYETESEPTDCGWNDSLSVADLSDFYGKAGDVLPDDQLHEFTRLLIPEEEPAGFEGV